MSKASLASLLFLFLNVNVFCIQKISVLTPLQLSSKFEDEDGIPFALANYGKIPYGAHFIGGLALADPVDACDAMDHFSAGEMQVGSNVIAVVRMGKCQNIIKTKNAQMAGAKIVIIVQDTEEQDLPQVSGSGIDSESIHIPTILIPKKHGDKLVAFIMKLTFPPVNPEDALPLVAINFPYDSTSEQVSVDFWYSNADPTGASFNFITQLAEAGVATSTAFKFTPNFITWDCLICKRFNYIFEDEQDCVSGGRYCVPDPDDVGPLTGRDVLFEDLRQACMWKINQNLYWKYISLYSGKFSADNTAKDTKEASEGIIGQIATPDETRNIKECVESSFFTSSNTPADKPANFKLDDNKIFAEHKELQLEYDITEFPLLLINHRPYGDNLTNFNETMKEMCKHVKSPPALCIKYDEDAQNSQNVQIMVMLIIIGVLTFAAVIVFSFYRNVSKKNMSLEMSAEANNLVSRYMALGDNHAASKEDVDEV